MLNPFDLRYIEQFEGGDKCLDKIFDWVDDKCTAGEFDKVDKFLDSIDVELQSTLLLIGVLSSTYTARSILKNRNAFGERARNRFLKTEGKKRTKALIRGLLDP